MYSRHTNEHPNQLITMVLKKHNNWTVLFKQRLKTTQLQLDKRKAFFGRNEENVLGAPTKHCEERLNEEDRKFLEIMKTSREGGV